VREVALQFRIPVFIDTGAFSELKADKAIPARLWRELLEAQLDLARKIGPRCAVVLPDKVGSQGVTIERIRRYRKQINQILDTGARGIVVLHQGRRSASDAAEMIAKILGRRDWILGFPVRAHKMEPSNVRATLQEISWHAVGVHLLGIGPANPRWGEYTRALAPLSASAWASSDAVVLKRLVQRVASLGPLTREQDIARAEIFEEVWGGLSDPLVGETVDPTEQLVVPSSWLPLAMAAQIAREGHAQGWLTDQEAYTFRRDPTKGLFMVLERDEPGPEWWLENEIERAWWARIGDLSTQMRKARGLVQLFGRGAPSLELFPTFSQMELG
jgi:hypothetical protein